MSDSNNNGINDNDEATFHTKSLAAGAVVGVFGGSIVLSLLIYFVPSLAGLMGVFAGSVCKPVETQLLHYKEAWACVEGGAAINGIDISVCAKKLDHEGMGDL
jgi:hypothetical protein